MTKVGAKLPFGIVQSELVLSRERWTIGDKLEATPEFHTLTRLGYNVGLTYHGNTAILTAVRTGAPTAFMAVLRWCGRRILAGDSAMKQLVLLAERH